MTLRELLVLLMICVIWGLHYTVMKTVVGAGIPPLAYAALRMSLVAALLLPWLKWHGPHMRWILLAGLGFGALNYAFMFSALKFTTASAVAIGNELYVPFLVILGALVLKDYPGWRRLSGIALALIGVAIIAVAKPDDGSIAPNHLLGIFLVSCCALSEAVAALAVKKVDGVSPHQLLAWFAVVGTLILWPLTLLLEPGGVERAFAQPKLLGIAMLYTVLFVSILAHGSYYWLLQRLPLSIVAPSGLLTTVIAVIGAVLILGEPLTVGLIAGMSFVLIGVGIVLWRQAAAGPKENSG